MVTYTILEYKNLDGSKEKSDTVCLQGIWDQYFLIGCQKGSFQNCSFLKISRGFLCKNEEEEVMVVDNLLTIKALISNV